jgi:hypothetical protein
MQNDPLPLLLNVDDYYMIIHTDITGEPAWPICRLINSPLTMFRTIAAVGVVVLLVLSSQQAYGRVDVKKEKPPMRS